MLTAEKGVQAARSKLKHLPTKLQHIEIALYIGLA